MVRLLIFGMSLFTSFLFTNEQTIKALEERIQKLEMDLSNKEVMSQKLMFEEWHEYAETLEQAQKDQNELKKLRRQLSDLKNEANE